MRFRSLIAWVVTAGLGAGSFAAFPAAGFAADWPAISSRFPEDYRAARPATSNDRLGRERWSNPPEVLSPFDPSWFDYQPVLWNGRDDKFQSSDEYFDSLRALGFRGAMVYSQASPAEMVRHGVSYYNTCTTNMLYLRNKSATKSRELFRATRDRTGNVREPSLEDPRTDASERRNAAEAARRNAASKPLAYDLRDEASYTTGSAHPHDYDFSKASIASFRQWLAAKYGPLDALNAEWETDFASWSEVFPLMTDEIQRREYRKKGTMNLAPWADHREYNDDTFISAIARYGAEIHRHDPGAPFGIAGTQMPSAWGGFDYWKLCNASNFVEHYDVCGSKEIIRSFHPWGYPSFKSTSYRSVDEGLNAAWMQALHGDTGGLVWPYAGNMRNILVERKDDKLVPTENGRNLQAIFTDLRNGAPALIYHGEFQTDAIGVLYSQPSLRADWMFEVEPDGKSWHNRYSSFEDEVNFAAAGREGYYRLLEDLGLQYTCVASDEVADGELVRRGVKLFIVPRGVALSGAEIDGLRKFVEAGGVLVTDLMAGRMNENGRVWPGTSPIDELLGVHRAAFDYQSKGPHDQEDLVTRRKLKTFGMPIAVTMKESFGGLKAGEKFEIRGYQEPGLRAGAAQALAQTAAGPAILKNRVGQGTAITLNFDLPNYLTQRAAGNVREQTETARRLMRALVDEAGIAPPVRIARPGESEHPAGIELLRYRVGEAQVLAAIVNRSTADLGDVGKAELMFRLPKAAFVSDMRTGKRFGKTDTVTVPIEKGRPTLLGVLPYEVTALNAMQLVGDRLGPGQLPVVLNVIVQGNKPGDHVVHAELLDADGKPLIESLLNIPLPGGEYRGTLDFSRVPNKGWHKLRLTDILSGQSAEMSVSL
ncbi:MAG: beta-galactosidase [Planctomycetales bacterium]